MSNDQSPIRKVSPYKANKRVSTVRKLNVDFAGTALEEALMLQTRGTTPESKSEISLLDDTYSSKENEEGLSGKKITNNFIGNTIPTPNLIEKNHTDQLDHTDLSADLSADHNDLNVDQNLSNKVRQSNKIDTNISNYTDQYTNKDTITRPLKDLVDNQLSRLNQVDYQPSSLSTKLTNSQDNSALLEKNHLQDSLSSTKLINDQLYGYRTPNILDDEIMPNLTPSEQVILRRLFRLSYGFNRTITDSVSYSKLSEKCHLGLSAVKDALKSLQMKNLIKVINDNKHNPFGGNCYLLTLPFFGLKEKNQDGQLSTKLNQNLVDNQLSFYPTKSVIGSIKDDDDLNNTNHHQREVMMIYRKTTGNSWTKADSENYEKIKDIAIEKIELAIRLASQRATNRPNSLAYFIKEILSVSSPTKQSRSQQKKAMEKIIKSVSNSLIGKSYSISELADYVKEACIKDDVPFDHDLFNDLISKK